MREFIVPQFAFYKHKVHLMTVPHMLHRPHEGHKRLAENSSEICPSLHAWLARLIRYPVFGKHVRVVSFVYGIFPGICMFDLLLVGIDYRCKFHK